MNRFTVTIALVAALLFAAPGMSSAVAPAHLGPEPSLLAKVMDAVFIRPPAAVAGIAASAFGVALLPITWPAGAANDVMNDTVGASWRFVVERPLGRFSD